MGETIAEVRELIQATIDFHLEGIKKEGLSVPTPVSICDYVEMLRQVRVQSFWRKHTQVEISKNLN